MAIHANSATHPLSRKQLKMLQKRAKKLLKRLVTKQGIYASTDLGWKGAYYAWFGRDSSITADLVFEAEKDNFRKLLSKKCYMALQTLTAWQGSKNNPETGEELGKLPHEIREKFGKINEFQHSAASNNRPWFIDGADGLLKNWDSCDSTPLWIITTIRGHRYSKQGYDDDTIAHLKSALLWCLENIKHFGGLAGFTAAENQPGRTYSGLHNQAWKDSFQIYQYSDGVLAVHPIKDVLLNAEIWAALKYGARIFKKRDELFSHQLLDQAELLRKRFNDADDGFLIKNEPPQGIYFAEAIDGNNQQLKSVAADVGMCLWAYYDDECIIDRQYMDRVVARVMQADIFNLSAGIRNYSLATQFKQGTSYHGSPFTYWPVVSAMTMRGLDHLGYKTEARLVAEAMLKGVSNFETCIELFVETKEHTFEPWHHPKLGQQSSANQAWTAAGIYYATQYLLR